MYNPNMTEKNTVDLQDEAFKAARENPTTDHELLELFATGDFQYKPYAKIKTREEYEKENWDGKGGWFKQWLSSFRG